MKVNYGNVPRRKGLKPEEREERDIRRLFTLAGGIVSKLSQGFRKEPGGTRQSRGLPDLWVAFPHAGKAGWFECKSPDALREWQRYAAMESPLPTWKYKGPAWEEWRHAREQLEFGQHCKACGIPWGIGAFREAQAFLVSLGLAREEDGLIRVRTHENGRDTAEEEG